jgi:CBS domain-containing protein
MRIRDVIAGKSSQNVVTISPDATVRALISLLSQHNVGALVVSHDGAAVEGIVSERDVVRRLHENEDVLGMPVRAIMTSEVHTCEPGEAVHDLMLLMTEHRIRHVPVIKDGVLSGIVSIGDVVKHRMSELEFERDQLDRFVHTQQT